MTPNRAQLLTAHHAADLAGSLDEALANPLLAKCLAITAPALQAAPAVTTIGPVRLPARVAARTFKHAAGRDFKRACAADTDD